MHAEAVWTADEALEKLKAGNRRYLEAETSPGDISPRLRAKTWKEGQRPHTIVITCSDSRVIPESIFSAGIGELFVIRVAGNVLDDHQLGSVEYAAEHLGTPLAVVLGHTGCGAVHAAIHDRPGGYVKSITDRILEAIGEETDEGNAVRRNAEAGARTIRESLKHLSGLRVCSAVYHLEDGRVEFLD